MNGVAQTMFNCIKYEIYGQSKKLFCPQIFAPFLIALYKLSKVYDVAHLVGDAINKNGVFENLPTDIDENDNKNQKKIR